MTQIPPTLDRLIWIDLEMTGLNPDRDHIIEIAAVITDANLEVIAGTNRPMPEQV
jgi:oligoribonuclease